MPGKYRFYLSAAWLTWILAIAIQRVSRAFPAPGAELNSDARFTYLPSARKLLDMLETKPGSTQRVVLIDFPHRDMKSVGLVTRVIREEGSGRELAAVYVPTTPNPTSGYLEIVPVELLTPTDWTVDQAMSFIISGGAVAPDAMPFTRAGER